MTTMPRFALVSALALAASAASAADLSPLVAPADLEAALDEVRVIDIRSGDADGFAGGHVPGAASAPYQLFRGPAENPGAIVSPDALEQTYRELGLETDDHVVITYQGSDVTDFGAAARVYWTLKSSGFEDLSILNGGINAWTEAGYDLTDAPAEVEASDIEITWNDQWTATAEDVQQAISSEDGAMLLDARPESFWSGEQAHPAAAKPGTLPQSQYFEHAGWFSGGPTIVDADAAREIAAEQDFSDAESIISFCNTGHWAATNWFALSELAGIENVKLYPESMVGWSNAGYEMANVPGPLRMMWSNITSAF